MVMALVALLSATSSSVCPSGCGKRAYVRDAEEEGAVRPEKAAVAASERQIQMMPMVAPPSSWGHEAIGTSNGGVPAIRLQLYG